jgi:hypothetical protein
MVRRGAVEALTSDCAVQADAGTRMSIIPHPSFEVVRRFGIARNAL